MELENGKEISLDSDHIEHMNNLYKIDGTKSHPPWTLDSYIDQDLWGQSLIRYNSDQVLSRWLHKRHERMISQENDPILSAHFLGFLSIFLAGIRDWFQGSMKNISTGVKSIWLNQDSITSPDIEKNPIEVKHHSEQRQPVLMVSQLWLFKLGGE